MQYPGPRPSHFLKLPSIDTSLLLALSLACPLLGNSLPLVSGPLLLIIVSAGRTQALGIQHLNSDTLSPGLHPRMTAPNPVPPVGQTWVLSEANLETKKDMGHEWSEPAGRPGCRRVGESGKVMELVDSALCGPAESLLTVHSFARVTGSPQLWPSSQGKTETKAQGPRAPLRKLLDSVHLASPSRSLLLHLSETSV